MRSITRVMPMGAERRIEANRCSFRVIGWLDMGYYAKCTKREEEIKLKERACHCFACIESRYKGFLIDLKCRGCKMGAQSGQQGRCGQKRFQDRKYPSQSGQIRPFPKGGQGKPNQLPTRAKLIERQFAIQYYPGIRFETIPIQSKVDGGKHQRGIHLNDPGIINRIGTDNDFRYAFPAPHLRTIPYGLNRFISRVKRCRFSQKFSGKDNTLPTHT